MVLIDPILIILFGGTLLFLTVLVIWVLWKPLLAVVPGPPDAVRRDLAYRLRAAGHTVDASKGPLRIKIDSLASLKVHVRPGAQGTEIRYEVDATNTGWAIVLIFALIGYLGLVAVIISIVIHVTARGFARSRVVSLLGPPALGTLPVPDVRSLLVEGLSEAQRLASEALEYEREARQNSIGLVILGATAVWAIIFVIFGAYILLPGPNPIGMAAAIASGVSVTLGVLCSLLVYSRSSALIQELEADVSYYRAAWAGEVMGGPAPGGPRGGLEILLWAAARSPHWRDIRRRRRLWQDPFTGITLFILAYGAIFLPIVAFVASTLPWEWRAFLGGLGALFAIGVFRSVRSWLRDVRERDEQDRSDWQKRREAIEAELWRILSG